MIDSLERHETPEFVSRSMEFMERGRRATLRAAEDYIDAWVRFDDEPPAYRVAGRVLAATAIPGRIGYYFRTDGEN